MAIVVHVNPVLTPELRFEIRPRALELDGTKIRKLGDLRIGGCVGQSRKDKQRLGEQHDTRKAL
ncbi:hypothetical protein RZS08_06825 [Arthrospira platensis SPKY1]|nr:hypothetical protein [Arthrospira platensis SPKY1]